MPVAEVIAKHDPEWQSSRTTAIGGYDVEKGTSGTSSKKRNTATDPVSTITFRLFRVTTASLHAPMLKVEYLDGTVIPSIHFTSGSGKSITL